MIRFDPSRLHATPSSTSGGPAGSVPSHAPDRQASFSVQALPSSQGLVLGTKTHPPVMELQLSVVQELSSLHTVGVPGRHAPPAHMSPFVQILPSLHGLVLLANAQPVAGAQVSVVHTLLSLHTVGVPG